MWVHKAAKHIERTVHTCTYVRDDDFGNSLEIKEHMLLPTSCPLLPWCAILISKNNGLSIYICVLIIECDNLYLRIIMIYSYKCVDGAESAQCI